MLGLMQSGEPGLVVVFFNSSTGILWVATDASSPVELASLESIRVFIAKPEIRDYYLRVDGKEVRLPNFAGGSDRSLFIRVRHFQLQEKGVIELVLVYRGNHPDQVYQYQYTT